MQTIYDNVNPYRTLSMTKTSLQFVQHSRKKNCHTTRLSIYRASSQTSRTVYQTLVQSHQTTPDILTGLPITHRVVNQIACFYIILQLQDLKRP